MPPRQGPAAFAATPPLLPFELGRGGPQMRTWRAWPPRRPSPPGGPGRPLFVAVDDLYREQQPRPAVRPAILRLLGDRGDVVSLGRVTDRGGRTGAALAVDSGYSGLPTRHVFVFDDTDGHLIATEQVLTERAGRLNVPVPSVISYQLYRE